MVVREARLQLLRNLGEHFIGIQRGDGVSRNCVQQRKMPRLRPLFLEEARVFHRNRGFARQHAQQFEMAFVERALLVGKYGHRADGAVIRDQRNAAETTAVANWLNSEFLRFLDVILPNQHGLPRPDDVLRDVISHGA